MDKKEYGVHQSHCCYLHGCKYGEVDCPVVSGELKQDYPCEDCNEDDKIIKDADLEWLNKCKREPKKWNMVIDNDMIKAYSSEPDKEGDFESHEFRLSGEDFIVWVLNTMGINADLA